MFIENPYRGTGLSAAQVGDPQWDSYPWVCDANAQVAALLAKCPKHAETPMIQLSSFPGIAQRLGLGCRLSLKNETARMGLGSFKALGAAFVIAQQAALAVQDNAWDSALAGKTYVAASAGNHGLSVAAGARVFGANAIIVLAETVPAGFAERLRGIGADVVVYGSDYAASMAKAVEIADEREAMLLSDSSWPGYLDPALKVMEGYTQLAWEAVGQLDGAPTHIYLQAGVGGLAAGCAAVFRRAWGDAPQIVVVEPDAAPALIESIKQGKAVYADGPASNMGRLDCKEPSLLALKSLSRDADAFMTISDQDAANAVEMLSSSSAAIDSTPSGVGGLAGAVAQLPNTDAGADEGANVLCIISEGADD